MAESIREGTLKTWTKQVGDTVEADEEVATIETDKIDVSVNAPKAGKIVVLLAGEEDTVRVGQDLFRIEYGVFESEPKSEEPQPTKDESEPSDQQVDKSTPPPLKPDTAIEKDTSPPVSEGGPSKKDLKETKKPAPEKKESKLAPKAKEESKPALAPGNRRETCVKMSHLRLRIAERLKESQNTAAFLTTFNKIDMSSLMELRSKY
ncbi:single hybrid motif-containing protein [Peniophora sp. CONT]|nr:single hybrid motif-containing protein [Peniophora sp. CONT]